MHSAVKRIERLILTWHPIYRTNLSSQARLFLRWLCRQRPSSQSNPKSILPIPQLQGNIHNVKNGYVQFENNQTTSINQPKLNRLNLLCPRLNSQTLPPSSLQPHLQLLRTLPIPIIQPSTPKSNITIVTPKDTLPRLLRRTSLLH